MKKEAERKRKAEEREHIKKQKAEEIEAERQRKARLKLTNKENCSRMRRSDMAYKEQKSAAMSVLSVSVCTKTM